MHYCLVQVFNVFFQIRVWSRKDAIESTRLAVSVAENVLNYYEEFFNIPYPLPKMGRLKILKEILCAIYLSLGEQKKNWIPREDMNLRHPFQLSGELSIKRNSLFLKK